MQAPPVWGVDHAVDVTTFHEICQQVTSGRGVDCIIECSGSQQALSQSLKSVRLGGRIVLVGSVFPGCNVDIDLEQIVRRNLSIFGIHNYTPRNLQQAVAFAASNAHVYPFQELVTDWFALDEIEAAIEKAGQGKSLRVGLKM
jgi:alcohol dehydrogenase